MEVDAPGTPSQHTTITQTTITTTLSYYYDHYSDSDYSDSYVCDDVVVVVVLPGVVEVPGVGCHRLVLVAVVCLDGVVENAASECGGFGMFRVGVWLVMIVLWVEESVRSPARDDDDDAASTTTTTTILMMMMMNKKMHRAPIH